MKKKILSVLLVGVVALSISAVAVTASSSANGRVCNNRSAETCYFYGERCDFRRENCRLNYDESRRGNERCRSRDGSTAQSDAMQGINNIRRCR